jgi:hypothetical protein
LNLVDKGVLLNFGGMVKTKILSIVLVIILAILIAVRGQWQWGVLLLLSAIAMLCLKLFQKK